MACLQAQILACRKMATMAMLLVMAMMTLILTLPMVITMAMLKIFTPTLTLTKMTAWRVPALTSLKPRTTKR